MEVKGRWWGDERLEDLRYPGGLAIKVFIILPIVVVYSVVPSFFGSFSAPQKIIYTYIYTYYM